MIDFNNILNAKINNISKDVTINIYNKNSNLKIIIIKYINLNQDNNEINIKRKTIIIWFKLNKKIYIKILQNKFLK